MVRFSISHTPYGLLLFLCSIVLSACGGKAELPTTFTEVSDSAQVYPDYRDVTIPPNIAPLNIIVTDSLADAFVADIGGLVCGAGKDGKFDIDSVEWRRVLSDAKGKDVTVTIFARRDGGWVRQPGYTFHVAEEPIDAYITYRLIEPGYEVYQQLGIYQRNLTSFDVTTIYENDRDASADEAHCINCHNFQNYDTQRSYLHVREGHKGTVFTHGREARKVLIKHDSILTSGAYGNWHPTLPLVAYSTNRTAQFFHIKYREKIEVYDNGSDLLLYDADRNEVKNIFLTKDYFETFPCWSADGTRLFYCSARAPKAWKPEFEAGLVARYDSLHYDIYSMPFDTINRTFGEPRLEVDASSQNLSASLPRISPDGRYLLFAFATYGQFHLYHRDSDLWVKDLQDSARAMRPLSQTNSPEAEGYHGWSSNGRWMVFSSRRDDGDFTRLYFAYFDAQGRGHRAFMLPQRDPEYNQLLLKSYNMPELTRTAVPFNQQVMEHVIRHTDSELATYTGKVEKTQQDASESDKK